MTDPKRTGAFSRASLVLKFIYIAVPLTLLAAGLTLSLLQYVTFRADVSALDLRMARLAATEAKALAAPVINSDGAGIDLLVSSIIADPDVVAVRVTDGEGVQLGALTERTAGEGIVTVAPIEVAQEGATQVVGRVELVYTRDGLWAALAQQIRVVLLVTTALVIAVVVSSLAAFNIAVLNPLRRFGEAIDEAQTSNQYVPVDTLGEDEIGRLAAAYNVLQKKQKTDEAELRRIQDNLETLVETRTDELRSAVATLEAREAEVIRARDDVQETLDSLQSAQDQLVQAEKMASLGQLTAGIAHEIKNPLNFVNNFSTLSMEMFEELEELVDEIGDALAKDVRDEITDLNETISENLAKINEHGRRADAIVRNMLLHSRSGPSEAQMTLLNAIVDEALKLSFHSSRAELDNFNVEMITNYDEKIGDIQCFPQDISRVFINVFSNAMYATNEKKASGIEDYWPEITVSTEDRGDSVLVRIADNGPGIPPDAAERIFTPFYTTKPAGSGTGLGLSITFEIVVTRHSGQIHLAENSPDGAVFVIELPKLLPGFQAEDDKVA